MIRVTDCTYPDETIYLNPDHIVGFRSINDDDKSQAVGKYKNTIETCKSIIFTTNEVDVLLVTESTHDILLDIQSYRASLTR